MKNKTKVLLTSLATIAMSASVAVGGTYALFTSEDKVNIAATSGTVNVKAQVKGIETGTKTGNGIVSVNNEFTVTETDGEYTFSKMLPGDFAVVTMEVANGSNVDVRYRTLVSKEGGLADALVWEGGSEWALWVTPQTDEEKTKEIQVRVEFPIDGELKFGEENKDNQYQNAEATLTFAVQAVQSNKTMPDKWDGTVDTSWYNETDTEFTLNTSEQFAGFAKLVGTTSDHFAGKTIELGVSVDLNGQSFAPIGTTGERDNRNRLITEPFKGTFNGNGNTISNLSQSGWDFGYEWGQYGSIGLFSELESATVKNVVLEGFDCAIEGGDIAFIAGSATGNCSFENIEIKSGSIGTYNNGIGGIIGWSGAGTYHFKNITLGEDVVLGGLWGSFDSSIGGIVGQAEPGATYNFENVDIACRLDAYNDCTASYDYYNYRMCGMIIGRLEETTTIDGVNYPDTSKYNITCKNVTVTYGDWANYHYCRAEGQRAVRVEAGYAYGGISADYDHSLCTVHHMELIAFDQIFGGDQFGVKGLKNYEGVRVIYNNK